MFLQLIWSALFYLLIIGSYSAEDKELDKIVENFKTLKTDIHDYDNWNNALKIGFISFKKVIENSNYFSPHKETYNKEDEPGYIRPAGEYIAFLASHSANPTIARLLDYMIKTSGPFGFRDKKASLSDRFIYELAAKAVVETDKSLAEETYNSKKLPHAQALQNLQKSYIKKEKDSLEDAEQANAAKVVNKHPQQIEIVLASRNDRWKSLLDFIRSASFFHHENEEHPKKYMFLNDLFLLSFSLGLAPRLTHHASFNKPTYLFEEWETTNKQMESVHNYVQCWFPISTIGMGDRSSAPRLTQHLVNLVSKSKEFSQILKVSLNLSFLRMATFWGQELSKDLALETKEQAWEDNWINFPHNYQRMNRILLWLRAFEMNKERAAMETYLKKVVAAKGTPRLIKSRDAFWFHPAPVGLMEPNND